MPPTPAAPAASVEVLKSSVPWMLAPTGFGLAGEMPWPLNPGGLLQLYLNSPEHCRAVHIKASGAFGLGLEWERDQDAARFGSLLETSSAVLGEDIGIDWETYGNAFLETTRGAGGRLIALRRLPAVTMIRMAGGRAAQRIIEPDYAERIIQFDPGETLQLRHPCPGGTWYSYPDWVGGHGMMELAESAVEFNRAFFSNSAIPEYAIISTGFELAAKQKEDAKAFFSGQFKGFDKAHRTLYLHLQDKEHTLEFRRITADLKDADFLRLLDAARDRLPIAHGVPPRMLGIMQAGSLGGGGEVAGQLHTFELHTLAPRRARMIAQWLPLFRELGIKITAERPEVAFRAPDLTPPEQSQLGDLAPWVQAGIITADEARAMIATDRGGSLTKSDSGDVPTAALVRLLMRRP